MSQAEKMGHPMGHSESAKTSKTLTDTHLYIKS